MLSTLENKISVPSTPWWTIFNWRRLLIVGMICSILYYLLGLNYDKHTYHIPMRIYCTGFASLVVYGLFERWPLRLPSWLTRWALQVVAVGATVPISIFLFFYVGTASDAPPFWENQKRLNGFLQMMLSGTLIAPWTALVALLRQREASAKKQTIAFELERSELAHVALDARMRLLTAQAQPHFLFNTLANVQALVEVGSPQAPKLLQCLTDYLRAAVPRLDGSSQTLSQELDLVRAYLELMKMRMPDRLTFDLYVEDDAMLLQCPPMTLLTLVENAVQHGIDPSEDGGNITVLIELLEPNLCRMSVIDSGVGFDTTRRGLGTGIPALRERLLWAYGASVTINLYEEKPHGVRAVIQFETNRK